MVLYSVLILDTVALEASAATIPHIIYALVTTKTQRIIIKLKQKPRSCAEPDSFEILDLLVSCKISEKRKNEKEN